MRVQKKHHIGKIRKTWQINPRTRVRDSKKLYRRHLGKRLLRKQLKDIE